MSLPTTPTLEPILTPADKITEKRDTVPAEYQIEFDKGVESLKNLGLVNATIAEIPTATILGIGISSDAMKTAAQELLADIQSIKPATTIRDILILLQTQMSLDDKSGVDTASTEKAAAEALGIGINSHGTTTQD